MSIILILYLADICEGLYRFFLGLGFAFIFLSIVCGIGVIINMEYEEELAKKLAGKLVYTVVGCTVSFFITVFIPSKTTMLAYTGISVSKELKAEIQSSDIYQKVEKVLNDKLDSYIAEQEKKK